MTTAVTWANRFMLMAEMVASWSKDPKTKVGCVITDNQNRVLGVGYNGFPRGVVDSDHRYQDRETKLLMVKHAEENAIFNSTGSVSGANAYVTLMPCCSCTGTLIQAGISTVFCPTPSEEDKQRHYAGIDLSEQMFAEAGVSLLLWDKHKNAK